MSEYLSPTFVVPIVVALISGFVSYLLARRNAKQELEKVKQEQSLSVRREALLFGYRKKYESLQTAVASFTEMQNSVYWLFPRCLDYLPQDNQERKEVLTNRYKEAVDAYNKAYDSLKWVTPFISKDTCSGGQEILKECQLQIAIYRGQLRRTKNAGHDENDAYDRTKSIQDLIDEWNDKVRAELDASKISL